MGEPASGSMRHSDRRHLGGRALIGREDELAAARAFLAGAHGRVLVVEGDAGIGKTTFLGAARAEAETAGQRVLAAEAGPLEGPLAFSGLHDLLPAPLADVGDRIPAAQRRVLERALLLTGSDAPVEPGQLAFAVLGVLRAFADHGAVLIVVDDEQWLDEPSTTALGYALRRSAGTQLRFVVSHRSGTDERLAGGLPSSRVERVHLRPLSLGATHRLIVDAYGNPLPRPVLMRVHDTAEGNPFYALELARALLEAGQPAEPSRPIPVPTTLETLIQARLAELSVEGRTLVLHAAAMAPPERNALVAAAGEAAFDEVLERRVLEVERGQIRFAHPLLAAGAYSSTPPHAVRAAHRRLATLVSRPDRRARHLALAAEEPSAEVARTLDDTAERHAALGAATNAAEYAELALELTPIDDADARERRTVRAAELAREANLMARAVALAEPFVAHADAGPLRARALLALARARGDDLHLKVELLRRAASEAGDDAELRLGCERYLAEILMNGDVADAQAHAATALRLADQIAQPQAVGAALALLVLIHSYAGAPLDDGVIERALALDDTPGLRGYSLPATTAGIWLMYRDRLTESRDLLESSYARAAESGDDWSRVIVSYHLAELECRAGRLQEAERWSSDGLELIEQLEHEAARSAHLAVQALVDLYRGRLDEASTSAQAALELATEVGDEMFRLQSQAVLGVISLARGDAGGAAELLGPLHAEMDDVGFREPSLFLVLPSAIEALAQAGASDQAAALLAVLEERAALLDSVSSRAAAARCRGLVAVARGQLEDGVLELEAALDYHARIGDELEAARTLTMLGSVQRQVLRRSQARNTLTAAIETLDRLGAAGWADCARRELARIGGRVREGELTAGERRVAELVAEGRSNKDVAEALVVTVRAVEANLTRVYEKLGIRSRTELVHALAAADPTEPSG